MARPKNPTPCATEAGSDWQKRSKAEAIREASRFLGSRSPIDVVRFLAQCGVVVSPPQASKVLSDMSRPKGLEAVLLDLGRVVQTHGLDRVQAAMDQMREAGWK
jgi:hypothetical protein